MRGLDVVEEHAVDTENERYLREVADHGPTMEEALFSLCRTVCERLGPNHCPFGKMTRDGTCVANHSPCVIDSRQPDASAKAAAKVEEQRQAAEAEAQAARDRYMAEKAAAKKKAAEDAAKAKTGAAKK